MLSGVMLTLKGGPLSGRGGQTLEQQIAAMAPVAWFDPSDLSTMYQTDDTSTPVTANNDPVGRRGDKSGNGKHATQAVAANRGLYKTSGGLHYISADGAGDEYDLPALGVTLAQNRAWFGAMRHRSTSNYGPFFTLGSAGGARQRWTPNFSASNAFRIEIQDAGYSIPTPNPGTDVHVVGVVLDGTTLGDHTLYMDGVAYSATGTETLITVDTNNLLLGAASGTGDIDDYGQIFFDRVPTADEIAILTQYYAQKGGVSL